MLLMLSFLVLVLSAGFIAITIGFIEILGELRLIRIQLSQLVALSRYNAQRTG